MRVFGTGREQDYLAEGKVGRAEAGARGQEERAGKRRIIDGRGGGRGRGITAELDGTGWRGEVVWEQH